MKQYLKFKNWAGQEKIQRIVNKLIVGWIFIILIFVIALGVRNSDLLAVFIKPAIYSPNTATPAEQTILCDRTEYYEIPPEFLRVLSLIQQRFDEHSIPNETNEYNQKFQTKAGFWYHCLNIQYDDLSKYGGAEGVFLFDENSSPNNLLIYVDSSYKSYDDIFTAILLSHEIRHAVQFLELSMGLKKLSCVDKEVEAFRSQLEFLHVLNKEELDSLIARLTANPNKNSAYASLTELSHITYDSNEFCGKNQDCFYKKVNESLKNLVMENPFYQEQCKGDIESSPVPAITAPPEGNPMVNCAIQSPCNKTMQLRKNDCNNLVCCQLESTFFVATSQKCKQAHDIFNSVYGTH